MKTENEIRVRLKDHRKNRRATEKRFDQYDNHEDMEALEAFDQRIAELEWVLGIDGGVP